MLASAQYSHATILLPASLLTLELLGLVYPSLAPGATLEIRGEAAESEASAGELKLAGLVNVEKQGAAVSNRQLIALNDIRLTLVTR